MKKRIKIISMVIITCIICVELVGRYFGLCNYPLYLSNKYFEYIHAPNQSVTIYRNKFSTNSYSMRSKPINTKKDTCSILFIGDSIINGGNLTDNDSLGTSILELELTNKLKKNIRVLNISAGSWGPDNGAEYIKQYGLFDANLIVLVVSSHDAYDNISHEEMVGIHPQFPSQNSALAWTKLIERGWQQISMKLGYNNSNSKINNLGISKGKEFNSGFDFFLEISKSNRIPLLVYLHPTKRELNSGQLNKNGNKIVNYCSKNNIPLINELTSGISIKQYRDGIHYNNSGQKFLAKNIFTTVSSYF